MRRVCWASTAFNSTTFGTTSNPWLLEVVLGRPHRVVPERVAVLGIGEEIRVGPTVVVLAVMPRVREWPIDPGVGHVHRPVEKRPEMHRDLQSPSAGE